TKGYGISVHRRDCANYVNAAGDASDGNRWIDVAWSNTGDEKYQTAINITARERSGLVMDIATVLNTLKVKVSSLSARDVGDGNATVFITMEVKNKTDLNAAISKMMSIQGVSDISRSGGVKG